MPVAGNLLPSGQAEPYVAGPESRKESMMFSYTSLPVRWWRMALVLAAGLAFVALMVGDAITGSSSAVTAVAVAAGPDQGEDTDDTPWD
jgi:hypothetical protein